MLKFFVIFFLIAAKCTSAFVIPQELPSILSLVYSNIPQIRKGHDSRYGFGFRLGDNADIQFVLELGPQSETRPIGLDTATSRKRAVSQSDFNESTESITLKKIQKDKKLAEAENWLKNWSKDQFKKKKLDSKLLTMSDAENRKKPPIVNGMLNLESNTITMVPENALDQLTALYKMKNRTTSNQEEENAMKNK
ncbi:uncharacterized protein LOC129615406 [Condylostylus longicornis]|uniref:uncharacterized protein LOC129615406 n=1 Tax=Condylostylus longicornis TaxID=2530218 RepID=UPI00244DDFDF|nr:uncharacterized protein LOC129615406 [Condylostylus longicornis]